LAAGVGQLTSDIPRPQEPVRTEVVSKLARLGTHWQQREGGEQVEVPGLAVEPDDVQIEEDPDGRTIRVSVDYTRNVKLKPLDRFWTIPFHTTRQGVRHQ